MDDLMLLSAILDSLKAPILVAGTDHVTRYMNKVGIAHYKGGASLIGRSLLDCHSEAQQRTMVQILAAMQQGLDERLILDRENDCVYMRAVRGPGGELLGYYERYEDKG